jgi:hypothetical protein
MKVTAALIIILALAIGIVPQFNDCASQGRALTLADGRSVPMKCHWTARAEIGLAVPLLAGGVMMFRSKRKETMLTLNTLGILLGAFVILIPTVLIGVCSNPDMICNSFMEPFLLFTGGLVIALSAYGLFRSLITKDGAGWALSA